MIHSARLAARILLAIGGLAAAGCGDETTSSVIGCNPPSSKACVTREEAWNAARSQGAAGASSTGEIPAECPGIGDIKSTYFFATGVGLKGDLLAFTGADGDQCCYAASYACEGRPFVVQGVHRTARLGREASWG